MDEHEIQCNDGRNEAVFCVAHKYNHKSDYETNSEAKHNQDEERKNGEETEAQFEEDTEPDKMEAEKIGLSKFSDISSQSSRVHNDLAAQLADRDEQLAQAKETIEIMQKQLTELESNGTKVDKMKMLAVKLKKDLASTKEELAKAQHSEKEAKEQLRTISREYEKVSSLYQQSVRNFQTLQAEYDRLQDEFDQCKVQAKSMNSDFSTSVAELSKVKEDYAEKLMENDMLNTKINGLKEMIAEYERKHQNLESTLIVVRSELEEEKKQKMDGVQLEKTVQELKGQLGIKTSSVAELEEKIREGKQISDEYNTLKPQYDKLVKEKEDMESENNELNERISEFEKKLESLALELEEERAKCCKLSSEKTNLLAKCKVLDEQYSRKLKLLEEKVSTLEESMGLAEEELKRKDSEFESYKVRVNKLLNQSKQDAQESVEVKELRKRLEVISSDKDSTEKRLRESLSEKVHLEEQIKEKISERKQLLKEMDKISSLNDENNILKGKIQELESCIVSEQRKCEMCCKEIEEQGRLEKESLKKEISDLEGKILSLGEEIDSLNQLNQSLMSCTNAHKTSSPASTSTPTELPQVSPLLESSECNYRTDYESDSSHVEASRRTPLSSFSSSKSPAVINPLLEILNSRQDNEEELIKYIKQIGDLTQLLKESESNNALLTEQNRVLKEEIRRLQRSIERVEIAQNLEYLKNVLVKFVSSEPGRAQLVPVLTTILKLSKQEEEIFSNFVTPSTNHTSPNSVPSNQANNWSNYLWQSFS